MLLIKNGLIHDAVNREPYRADILADGGRIVKIGAELSAPEGARVMDAAGLNVWPGFVDAHTHIGLDGSGIGYEGRDYNEMNDICCPQLRAIDGINPMDPSLKTAREAGVTTVCTGPGSANVLGGTFTAIKTVGRRVDDMTVRAEVAMKCAFGENPKRCYRDKEGRRGRRRDQNAQIRHEDGGADPRAGAPSPPESPRPPSQRYLHRPAHRPRI